MATRRYSVQPGDKVNDITEAAGAAVATKSIELTVDCATSTITTASGTRALSKEEVLLALEKLEEYIIASQWPPV
jgi:hypothetical protein